jgi:hypothetical protein
MCHEPSSSFFFCFFPFFPGKFSPEIQIKNQEIKKMVILEVFNRQKRGGKKLVKVAIFFIFGFQLVVKNYRRIFIWMCTSYLVYSQIWLNLLPKDDHHFFYIFQWLMTTMTSTTTTIRRPQHSIMMLAST